MILKCNIPQHNNNNKRRLHLPELGRRRCRYTHSRIAGSVLSASILSTTTGWRAAREEVEGTAEAKAVYLFSVNRVYAHHHPVCTYVLTHSVHAPPVHQSTSSNLSVYLPAEVFIGNARSTFDAATAAVRGIHNPIPFHPCTCPNPLE